MSLQAGAITLAQDLPDKVVMDQNNYRTTSDAVLNKRLVEIAPTNQTSYTPDGQNEIQINIASNSSFWDIQNSFLYGDINITNSSGTPLRSLERNGIHALFSSVELRVASTNSGVERQDAYNVFTAMEDSLLFSADELDTVYVDEYKSSQNGLALSDRFFDERQLVTGVFVTTTQSGNNSVIQVQDGLYPGTIRTAGDSTDADMQQVLEVGDEVIFGNAVAFTYTAISSYADGTGTITVTGGNAHSALQVGQPITLTTSLAAPNNVFETFVESITTNSVFIVSPTLGTAATITNIVPSPGPYQGAPAIVTSVDSAVQFKVFPFVNIRTNQMLVRKRVQHKSVRRYIGEGATTPGRTCRFIMRPRLGFFRQEKYFPLFLLPRGFDLVMRLDTNLNYRSFTTFDAYPVTDPTITVTLSNLRFCATMIDCHSAVNAEYLSVFQSPRGILIPYKTWVYHQKVLDNSSGDQVIDMNVGVRSASHVMSRFTTDYFYNSNSKTSRRNPCLSSFPALNLRNFQYSSGSLLFPLKEVEVGDADGDYPMNLKRHQKIVMKKNCDKDFTSTPTILQYAHLAGNMIEAEELSKSRTPYALGSGSINATYAATRIADMNGCIMVADLARDSDGRFSGLDLSVQPLRLEMEFSAGLDTNIGTARVIQSFIANDTYAYISESQGFNRLN